MAGTKVKMVRGVKPDERGPEVILGVELFLACRRCVVDRTVSLQLGSLVGA
jgi:hypothetical protein